MSLTMVEMEKYLKVLRLSGILATLETRALQVNQGEMSFLDAFGILLQDELDRRKSRLIERRFTQSGLPEMKTLSDFDWGFNPKVPKKACFELVALKFITDREDALLIGSPGTGKSHVVKALGHAAVRASYRVIYREAHKLFEEITDSTHAGNRQKLMQIIGDVDLLIIDDLFVKKLPRDAGDDLLEIIMNRYEKKCTVITSNRLIEDWPKLLGDATATSAVLDRLMHHAWFLKFEGKSYRLHEAAQKLAKRKESH